MNMWALGDYPRLAREVVGGLGPRLVAACGVRAGQRVLDVGTGSGLAALAAAEVGASVVGADITPELLDAARSSGAPVEWVFGDAQKLPFSDAEFDVVLSCVGAMFAPDQRATADELVRVCRPGGVVGMVNWTPGGSIGGFFEVFGGSPALSWGDPDHVRSLFGDGVSAFTAVEERLAVSRFSSAEEYCAYYKANFGPVIAAFAEAEDPAALDRRFLAYAAGEMRAGLGYDYLLVVARRAG
ncbi:MAG TPA: class I SAM-dependent methyltransferase [Actinophytocola sp.]|jgi:ubiquinone/menaquinone biosynthesis C-methylase UbiE|uniref:class I SAM-dependent methyltransferase n=1 Tax=Actinophytocola sp. TaxID=1872138 RepID=UPI002F95535D